MRIFLYIPADAGMCCDITSSQSTFARQPKELFQIWDELEKISWRARRLVKIMEDAGLEAGDFGMDWQGSNAPRNYGWDSSSN